MCVIRYITIFGICVTIYGLSTLNNKLCLTPVGFLYPCPHVKSAAELKVEFERSCYYITLIQMSILMHLLASQGIL